MSNTWLFSLFMSIINSLHLCSRFLLCTVCWTQGCFSSVCMPLSPPLVPPISIHLCSSVADFVSPLTVFQPQPLFLMSQLFLFCSPRGQCVANKHSAHNCFKTYSLGGIGANKTIMSWSIYKMKNVLMTLALGKWRCILFLSIRPWLFKSILQLPAEWKCMPSPGP